MRPETFICEVCGEAHPMSDLRHFDGQDLCVSCRDTVTVLCDHCQDRIWREDDAGCDGIHLCRDCRDEHYCTCVDCGRLIANSEANYRWDDEDGNYPYCDLCFDRLGDRVIQEYYYKPEPIFYGDGPRYLGVELEIDGGGEYDSKAQRLLDMANLNGLEFVYIKHDGSLDDGLEIVTHPMSLQFHQAEMPWKAVMAEAIRMGYTSHKACTCGLHVHVSRAAFGEDREAQEPAIARILYFVEKHWEELLKFSRRSQRQLEQWAARYGFKNQPQEILDHAKKGGSRGRYSCVNLENYDTIEFRIFRGTLKYNTLIATLQMVDRICDVALYLSDDQLKDMSWTTFVSGIDKDKYPELIQYLKERRLYINEPVTEGEGEV